MVNATLTLSKWERGDRKSQPNPVEVYKKQSSFMGNNFRICSSDVTRKKVDYFKMDHCRFLKTFYNCNFGLKKKCNELMCVQLNDEPDVAELINYRGGRSPPLC